MDSRSLSVRLSRTCPLMAFSSRRAATSRGKGVESTHFVTWSTVHSANLDGRRGVARCSGEGCRRRLGGECGECIGAVKDPETEAHANGAQGTSSAVRMATRSCWAPPLASWKMADKAPLASWIPRLREGGAKVPLASRATEVPPVPAPSAPEAIMLPLYALLVLPTSASRVASIFLLRLGASANFIFPLE
jgi:hypothetical protein